MASSSHGDTSLLALEIPPILLLSLPFPRCLLQNHSSTVTQTHVLNTTLSPLVLLCTLKRGEGRPTAKDITDLF